MKYKIFNNIEKNESKWKSIAILAMMILGVVCCLSFYYIDKTNESARNNGFLIQNGLKVDIFRVKSFKESVDLISKGHVKIFHEVFFGLEPDMQQIKANIEGLALNWVDDSGQKLYTQLQDMKYFEDIVRSDYSIEVYKDSIVFDYSNYPYKFQYFGKQKIIKGKENTYRNLITEGYIQETGITSNNLNGLKIINYKVVDNTDIDD